MENTLPSLLSGGAEEEFISGIVKFRDASVDRNAGVSEVNEANGVSCG